MVASAVDDGGWMDDLREALGGAMGVRVTRTLVREVKIPWDTTKKRLDIVQVVTRLVNKAHDVLKAANVDPICVGTFASRWASYCTRRAGSANNWRGSSRRAKRAHSRCTAKA